MDTDIREVFKSLNLDYDGYIRNLEWIFGGKDYNGKKLLNIGCGNGAMANLLSKKYNCFVTAIDPYKDAQNEEAINRALKETLSTNVTIIKTSIENFQSMEKFDYCYMIDALHHVVYAEDEIKADSLVFEKLVTLFYKISILLVRNGKIIIKDVKPVTPENVFYKTVMADKFLRNVRWSTKHNPEEYIDALELVGFKNIKTFPQYHPRSLAKSENDYFKYVITGENR